REARVDVDYGRAALFGLHHPLKPDRVALGHVGALDDDDVRVLQVLLERRRAAPPEGDPQTGDRGAVSDPGLVLHLDDAQRGVELLEQVVLLVVERGPAQVRDAEGALDVLALLVLLLPGAIAAVAHALGDHVHRPLERDRLPFLGARPAVPASVQAVAARDQLISRRSLRTQPAS